MDNQDMEVDISDTNTEIGSDMDSDTDEEVTLERPILVRQNAVIFVTEPDGQIRIIS